jgi:hypothetical protein
MLLSINLGDNLSRDFIYGIKFKVCDVIDQILVTRIMNSATVTIVESQMES